jgi:hypothetical protein
MADKMLVRIKRIEPYQGCGAKKPQEMAAWDVSAKGGSRKRKSARLSLAKPVKAGRFNDYSFGK